MKPNKLANRKSKYETLKRLYETNITVDSIAEDLVVCDINEDALARKLDLTEKNYDVIGVIEGHEPIGYVEREQLGAGTIRDYVIQFNTREIITNSTPLIQFLHFFKERKRIFVLEKNQVTKLITAADLQKPPVRILIFGYVTLLEMNLSDVIKYRFPEHGWQGLITENRLSKAEQLYQERLAKNEDINLIECLQISDKLQIIMNDESLREKFQLPSKNQWKRISNRVRDLRDKIAHSNQLGIDITWEEIIDTLEECEIILEASEELLGEPI